MKRLFLVAACLLGNLVFTAKAQEPSSEPEALLQDTLKQEQNAWEVLLQKGKEHQEHGRSKRAMELFEQGMELHACDTLRRALAEAYYSRGYYRRSIDLCQQMMQSDTTETELVLVARCYERLGMADSTIVFRQLIAERDVENYSNVQSLARIFNQLGMNELALFYLDRYYNADSTNLTINNQRAYILHELGQYKESTAEYQKLRDAGFRDATALYYDGVGNARLGKRNDAYRLLKEADERSIIPNGYIRAELGMVAVDVLQYEDCLENISSAFTLLLPDSTLSSSMHLAAAQAHLYQKHYRQAIMSYNQAQNYRYSLNNLCQIAYLYGQMGNVRSERQYYERFLTELRGVRRPERYESLRQHAEARLKEIREEQFFRGEVGDEQ